MEILFDGVKITAAAESPRVIKVQGHAISEADLNGELAIRGGGGFAVGAYRICAVDQMKNTLTLDRACCAGPASGLLGKMARFQGKPHGEVAEYYDSTLPDNASQGETRDRVLGMLNHLEPRILRSLADVCFKDELLAPKFSNNGDWPPDSYENLMWGHVRDAGRESAGQIIFGNLNPLRQELTRWAAGGPEKAWNLLDNEKRPLEWIASAALQTLVWWKIQGGLPKILQWENSDWHAYRSLETVDDFRMLDLEGHFNKGAAFLLLTPGKIQEQRRFSVREQRCAEREYVKLGKRRGLKRMPHKISPHYFNWYILHTFLGLRQNEIRQREIDKRATGIGDTKDPEDLASISIGIKRIADLVGFRRRSHRRTEKF